MSVNTHGIKRSQLGCLCMNKKLVRQNDKSFSYVQRTVKGNEHDHEHKETKQNDYNLLLINKTGEVYWQPVYLSRECIQHSHTLYI